MIMSRPLDLTARLAKWESLQCYSSVLRFKRRRQLTLELLLTPRIQKNIENILVTSAETKR